MNLEEARQSVGKLVMSRDCGNKMIGPRTYYHGPHKLKQVTKSGLCIFEDWGYYNIRVPPSLIKIFKEDECKEIINHNVSV